MCPLLGVSAQGGFTVAPRHSLILQSHLGREELTTLYLYLQLLTLSLWALFRAGEACQQENYRAHGVKGKSSIFDDANFLSLAACLYLELD